MVTSSFELPYLRNAHHGDTTPHHNALQDTALQYNTIRSHGEESAVRLVGEGDALGQFERERVHRPVHVLHKLAVGALLFALACLTDTIHFRPRACGLTAQIASLTGK